MSDTPLLDTIKTPQDLRKLRPDQMRQVADELRQAEARVDKITTDSAGQAAGTEPLDGQ